MVYLLEALDIGLGEHTITLLIAMGFYAVKLRLPMAYERCANIKHLGHLAHRVIEFFYSLII
jgi:hypothetical protein